MKYDKNRLFVNILKYSSANKFNSKLVHKGDNF